MLIGSHTDTLTAVKLQKQLLKLTQYVSCGSAQKLVENVEIPLPRILPNHTRLSERKMQNVLIHTCMYICMNNHVHRAPFSDIEIKKEVAKSKERRKEIHIFINY